MHGIMMQQRQDADTFIRAYLLLQPEPLRTGRGRAAEKEHRCRRRGACSALQHVEKTDGGSAGRKRWKSERVCACVDTRNRLDGVGVFAAASVCAVF